MQIYPAKTPPARTKPILIMSFSQNSGEPSGVSGGWRCITFLIGHARTVRRRNMMVGDLSFMRRFVRGCTLEHSSHVVDVTRSDTPAVTWKRFPSAVYPFYCIKYSVPPPRLLLLNILPQPDGHRTIILH